MSRRRHKPTEKTRTEVTAYSAVGVPRHDIAALLGIDTKTLLKYYPTELALGKARANAQVGKTLYNMAVSGQDIAATIFWAKSQMGMSERTIVQIEDKIAAEKAADGLEKANDPNDAADYYSQLMAAGVGVGASSKTH